MTHGVWKIPSADPHITQEDVTAVAEAIREKRLSQGKYVQKFEEEFAKYICIKHAEAICNGTAALHIALAALGIGPKDEVTVPSFSFVAKPIVCYTKGLSPYLWT